MTRIAMIGAGSVVFVKNLLTDLLSLPELEGCTIALHKAAKSQKSGAAMKLVFGVEDVEGFKAERERDGLRFGMVHRADGVMFANGKDPAGNLIQISNRGMKGG